MLDVLFIYQNVLILNYRFYLCWFDNIDIYSTESMVNILIKNYLNYQI